MYLIGRLVPWMPCTQETTRESSAHTRKAVRNARQEPEGLVFAPDEMRAVGGVRRCCQQQRQRKRWRRDAASAPRERSGRNPTRTGCRSPSQPQCPAARGIRGGPAGRSRAQTWLNGRPNRHPVRVSLSEASLTDAEARGEGRRAHRRHVAGAVLRVPLLVEENAGVVSLLRAPRRREGHERSLGKQSRSTEIAAEDSAGTQSEEPRRSPARSRT